jgi:hypothetical protein
MDESREERIARALDYATKAEEQAQDAADLAEFARERGTAAIKRGDGLDAAAWLAEFHVAITRRDAFLNLANTIRVSIAQDEEEGTDPSNDPDESRYLN